MQENIRQLINDLNGSLEEYTPIPFWFINDALTKEKLRSQLEDFKSKGVDGVVIHPRIGIPRELKYLSEEYFDLMVHTVKSAAELNMKVVLYDEGMYPSGSANGEVVRYNPEFAATGITLADSPDDGVVIAGPRDGKYIVEKPCGGTIRGIHFGQDDGEPDAPAAADILNIDAVNKFIELTHDRYYAHLKEYFGNTVIGFFTDEPNVLGRNARGFFPWSKGLLATFKAAGGNPEELWALFDKEQNEATAFYREFIKQRLNDVYYKSLSDWCAAHNIALMGHPAESADIDEEKYFHIPGQDLVFRWVSPERGGTKGKDSVMAKCSSDAARHMGRRRNSNECFGVCVREGIPWYFTGGDMKWFIDWLAVRGVNLFIPHAFYYSLAGKRKDERPPDVGPGNIWWKHYKLYSDYMKRVSYLMTDSKNAAKVAVLCESGKLPIEAVEPFYESQTEFNYLQKCMLDKCELRDGKLCIAGYEYEYVIGDDMIVPEVKHIKDITEIKACDRDLLTKNPCPMLRATHLVKNNVSMYFLVNEGYETIDEIISLPGAMSVVEYDLWTGKSYAVELCAEVYKKAFTVKEEQGEGIKFPTDNVCNRISAQLKLEPKESKLLICTSEACAELTTRKEERIINLTDKVTLLEEDTALFKKTYTAQYIVDEIIGNEVMEIEAEEMVECFCNGKPAGVSFWNTHRFECGELLKTGVNEIRFIVTGNAANRYTEHRIPYGILS